jgi:hypothetical protein
MVSLKWLQLEWLQLKRSEPEMSWGKRAICGAANARYLHVQQMQMREVQTVNWMRTGVAGNMILYKQAKL